ncbi:hypothetical protein ABPG72_006259 [Tetrahymena utriculariae]
MNQSSSFKENPQMVQNDFSIGVVLTAVCTAVLGLVLTGVKAVFTKAKNSIVGFVKNKINNFFHWDDTSAHQINKNPNKNRFDIRTCSICLNNIKNPVMSACNHPFCAECIFNMWQTKQKKKLNCPYCRRDMNLLYRDFEESEMKTQEEKKILKELKDYNALYSGHKRSFLEMIRDAPFLLKMLMLKIRQWKNMWYVVTTMITSGRLIASLIYIISPIDLLPESFLGPIGLVDDFAVIGIALVIVANISYQLLRREQ